MSDKPMPHVLVVVNKWWECDPFLNALLHPNAAPPGNSWWPLVLNHPHRRPNQQPSIASQPRSIVPRAIFRLPNCSLEIWCISDLLEHLPDSAQIQSNSEVKARELEWAFQGQTADLVITVGTAGYPQDESHPTRNGFVHIGTKLLMHNCFPNGADPKSNWQSPNFEKILDSTLTESDFSSLISWDATEMAGLQKRFQKPPLNPASSPTIDARYNSVAMGALNVWDYTQYDITDKATLAAFTQTKTDSEQAMSLETTHGLIHNYVSGPFLWISGITDRVGAFASEVNPQDYVQNSCAIHNAGVTVAWMLPKIDALMGR